MKQSFASLAVCLIGLALPTAAQSPSFQTNGLEWCGVRLGDERLHGVHDASGAEGHLLLQRAHPDEMQEMQEITILFFYTQQFADDFRDRGHMEDEIEKSVDLLNLSLDNSHVNATFRIVGIERHPAMPTRQFRAHDWIVNDQRAKSRRDELSADLVYALVDDPDGFAGAACQPGSFTSSTGEWCFVGSVNNWTPSVRAFDNENVWQTILRHEVGHNLGIQHSPEFGGNPRDGFYPGAVGYSSGPFSTDPDWYGTVMGANYLPRFSTSSERFDFRVHKNLVVGEPGIHEASTALLHSIGPVSDYRPPAPPAGSCAADAETLCLQDSRFSVALDWWTGDGRSGTGKVVHEGTNDSGLFYFFPPGDNWEFLIKVLNGCGVNDHVWVYGASATTLGYSIRVTDTVTGRTKQYRNEPGKRASAITDDKAFPESCDGVASVRSSPALELAVVPAASEDSGCTETPTTMCLQGGRYAVSVGWSKQNGEKGMAGVLRPRTDDSGLFYFFSPGNWEMLVKVLDGCANNDRQWVFAASATDVGLDLMVRDTVTGMVRNYTKKPGEPARAVADVGAFPEGCQPQ